MKKAPVAGSIRQTTRKKRRRGIHDRFLRQAASIRSAHSKAVSVQERLVKSDDAPPGQLSEARCIELVAGQRLVVEHRSGEDVIQIVAPNGRMSLKICLTPARATLELEGVDLRIRTAGDLSVEADRLAFHGRSSVALTSGGDALLYAAGDMHSLARVQNIKADLGNVNVTANDDVSINGERVRVNCDDV